MSARRRPGQKTTRKNGLENMERRPQSQVKGKPPKKAKLGAKPLQCTNIECRSFNIVEESGQQLCQDCGTVCQDVDIVNDNAFGEGRDGQMTMIGSHVGNDQARGKPFGSGIIRGIGGFESREITERNGIGHVLNSQTFNQSGVQGRLR